MIEFSADTAHKHLTWDEAWMYCLTLNHKGHRDWRMPTYGDFNSLKLRWPPTWFDCTGWPEGGVPHEGSYIIVPVRYSD